MGVLLGPGHKSEVATGFPYASGGVASSIVVVDIISEFSLRKWGCCQSIGYELAGQFVFPTQVGVLPHNT